MITAGVDIGAGTTKAVLMDDAGRILVKVSERSGARLDAAGSRALAAVLEKAGLRREDIAYVAATGYGRYQLPERDIQITEVTCHARGASYLFPGTRCLLDIGAQSTRAIRVDDAGRVMRFRMNDRCAAGAGRFLERVARALEVPLDDLGPMSLHSADPQAISSICAVLAESEVISLVTSGKATEDILMGAHLSIADRALALLRQVGVDGEVTVTGGVVLNRGMLTALERRLGRTVNASPDTVYAGAIGAALLGFVRLRKLGEAR
ncbi:MAG TPA: acyl-CoA dehydratase activase [Thermoplasmata archaeon]|nr:acyl-CoA dehydratase activase [Thermoplasmata archaeon]